MTQFPLKTAALALALALPFTAMAESSVVTGAGNLSTSAKLDFKITVPRILSLQVGAAGTTVNEVLFALTPADAASPGTTVTTNTGGNAPNGVTARLVGNSGNISLTANAPATGLVEAATAGYSIPYSQILTSSSAATLPHPVFGSGVAGTASAITPGANGVVDQSANWTFSFSNSTIVPPGTYGGQAKGGRVTYTAANP